MEAPCGVEAQPEQPQLRIGARIAVAGYGCGTYVSGTHTIAFDDGGVIVTLNLRDESWTVLEQASVLRAGLLRAGLLKLSPNGLKPYTPPPHDVPYRSPTQIAYSPHTALKPDCLFKVVVLGNSGVVKSSLLLRLTEDKYEQNYLSTVGVDYYNTTVAIHNKRVQLQMWDTAGLERFRPITRSYYRGSQGFVVVYDATDNDSFDGAKGWVAEIEQNCGAPKILLVANKSDRAHLHRKVTYQRGVGQTPGSLVCVRLAHSLPACAPLGKEYADSIGAAFFETSAKVGLPVSHSLSSAAKCSPPGHVRAMSCPAGQFQRGSSLPQPGSGGVVGTLGR